MLALSPEHLMNILNASTSAWKGDGLAL